MGNINLDDVERIQHILFGYKKNGRPRAVLDVLVEGSGIAEKHKKSKKKKHHKKKKRNKESQSLYDFYKDAFNMSKMDW